MPLAVRTNQKQEYSTLKLHFLLIRQRSLKYHVFLQENFHITRNTGSIFIFNLIVGTGALTLPYVFSRSGWLIGLFVIIALAFISFITVTFVIESMATTNAILHWQKFQLVKNGMFENTDGSQNPDDNSIMQSVIEDEIRVEYNTTEEYAPLLENSEPHRLPMPIDFYSITEAVEMGQMVSLYFKKVGVVLFYLCICIYLYGDLAIYSTAVAKSLRDVSCTFVPLNTSCEKELESNVTCWENTNVTRGDAYRIYLAAFLLLLGPFVFFNVQKTKYLQIITSFLRWLAFITMITLTIIQLAKGQGKGQPKVANLKYIPELFGICIYSFMCHHSLPSLITPISDKRNLQRLFAADYSLIVGFYVLLSLTGVFTFNKISDLYTLNFQPDRCNPDDPNSVTTYVTIRYFLALFPVFTLSTNFPIIGITLRNNLKAIMLGENAHRILKNIVVPLITIVPPVLISLITEKVDVLVSFTGTYAGSGIQYVIPVLLVYKSRQMAAKCLNTGVKNAHNSAFRHNGWLIFVLVWAISCIILATISKILDY